MKLLHLGDLHLGKRVGEFSLLQDQRFVLGQVVRLAARHKVDAVLLAGDLYDKPVPPAEAVELLDWFLTALCVAGHTVLAVSGNHDSPERLMATMEQFAPDLVLMDLHMPGTSGTTLTVQIREHPRFEQIPVVFLTGDQDPERQLEVLEHGADDFILKPVRPRHLIAAVQSRVRRARAAQTRQVVSEPEHHPVTGLFTRPVLMHK